MTRVNKGWKYLDMVWEKFIRLGIPYIVFITIAIVLKVAMPGNVQRDVDLSASGLLVNYIDPFNGALQEMWFVSVIMWFFLIYPAYKILFSRPFYMFMGLLVAYGMYMIPITWLPSYFAINRACHFFIFFYIGLMISRMGWEGLLKSWSVIIACIAGDAISWWADIDLLMALFASLGFWGMAIKCDATLSSDIFGSFRNYTYQIFLIGIFAQIFVKVLASKFNFGGSYAIWWLICVLAGIYIPVIVAKIAEKSKNRFLKLMMGM